jgi:hypothetical protein
MWWFASYILFIYIYIYVCVCLSVCLCVCVCVCVCLCVCVCAYKLLPPHTHAGKMYRPHVVRVASDEGVLSDVVKPCALTTLTKRYSDMSQAHWQRCQSDVGRRLVVAEREAAALHMSLAKAAPLDPQSIEIARVS